VAPGKGVGGEGGTPKRGGHGGRAGKAGSHRKGPTVGSGGQRRKGLEPRGATPPAEVRKGHPAARRAAATARRGPQQPADGRAAGRSTPRDGGGDRGAQRGRKPAAEQEIVTGRNAVVEALRAKVPVATLYLAKGQDPDDRVEESVELAARARVPVREVGKPELDRLTGGAVHQGIAITVPPYQYLHPDDVLARAASPALIVALDGVTDPRNLGAIIRSTTAFGGHGVVVPQRRSAGVTASAWKASAGTAARLPVAQATNLTRALKGYADAGLLVVGLDGAGELSLDDLEAATDPIVLVVGSEGRGLSRLVRDTCDLVVRIDMAGAAESLNASVAAAVALAEIARRRRNSSSA
jgi:23S rRNA (guanosine2251-2'-O)-methyltransferase